MRSIEDIEKLVDSIPNMVLKAKFYEHDVKFLLEEIRQLNNKLDEYTSQTVGLDKIVRADMFNEICDFAFSGHDPKTSTEIKEVCPTKSHQEIADFAIKKFIEYRTMAFPCG